MGLNKNTPGHIDISFRQDVFLISVVAMLLAVDLLVVEEDTVREPGTLEVIVSRAGTRTTPNSCPNLLTRVAALTEKQK